VPPKVVFQQTIQFYFPTYSAFHNYRWKNLICFGLCSVIMSLQPFVGLWPIFFFKFRNPLRSRKGSLDGEETSTE
jgi:hypothetical protein